MGYLVFNPHNEKYFAGSNGVSLWTYDKHGALQFKSESIAAVARDALLHRCHTSTVVIPNMNN
jgi:hypothetical protein